MKKINSANKENPKNIISKGMSMDGCIAGDSVSLMLAGWCKVFHHSTENLMIGRLAKPKIAKIEEYFQLQKSF